MGKKLGFALAIGLLLGCGQQSKQKQSPVTNQAAEPSPCAGGEHVRLSVRDMSLELQKHCNAAGESMKRLSRSADKARSNRTASGSAVLELIDAPLLDMRRDMATCLEMVHGMYEEHVGENRPSTGTKTQ